jgi:thymidylate synthase (FAD)
LDLSLIENERRGLIELVEHSTVELIKTNATDEDVAYAAWVSNFGSAARERDTSNIGKLIDFLYSNLHMSPFEHGSFTIFVDTPIFVAREFMRHRTFSYNETSGRYKELEPRFYVPRAGRPLVQVGRPGAYTFESGTLFQFQQVTDIHADLFEKSWIAYQNQLSMDVAREVARNVLPLATMTQFYATTNPRNLMQFLILRDDLHALDEIRAVAEAMREILASTMPLTYNVFERERESWRKLKELLADFTVEEIVERMRNNADV